MKNTVRIYDRAFNETGFTGSFTSLETVREFRGMGEAVLRLPAGECASLFMPDGYIRVPEGEMYRIISVERDQRQGEIRVRCLGLLSLLQGTVIPEEYTVRGNAAALMYALVRNSTENLPLSLAIGESVGDKNVSITSGRSYLYDDLVTLCYLGGLGMSFTVNNGKLLFQADAPRDRTHTSDSPVLVSRNMGTFASERMEWDLGGYKNVAVVSGTEKETGGRYTATVRSDSIDIADSFPDSSYFDRQTLVNFTSPVGPFMVEDALGDKVLDETAYTSAMIAAGAAVLGRCRPKLYLYGDTGDMAEELAVGDTVTVSDTEMNISGSATVETVRTVYSGNMKTVKTELRAELPPESAG